MLRIDMAWWELLVVVALLVGIPALYVKLVKYTIKKRKQNAMERSIQKARNAAPPEKPNGAKRGAQFTPAHPFPSVRE